MKELYNEGRVVGLSQYELYVRHSLSEFPDLPVMAEREWLAATLGDGQSMILKISKGIEPGVYDFRLPEGSQLCAAHSITASLFDGDVELIDGTNWAKNVKSYGSLLNNSEKSNPVTPGFSENTPSNDDYESWLTGKYHALESYMSVVDGLVIQPGSWEVTNKSEPYKELTPYWGINNADHLGYVRLRLAKETTSDFYILLTGFMYVPIVSSLSKFDSAGVDTEKPENGDFLGTECYPWGCKIIFSVPSEVYNMLTQTGYERKLPKENYAIAVDTKSVIDFRGDDPSLYYEIGSGKQFKDTGIEQHTTKLRKTEDDVSVLAGYRRSDKKYGNYSGQNYPPSLYGAVIDELGDKTLYPMDVAAPGTLKMFEDKDLAMAYPRVIPGVFASYKNDEGDIFIIDDETTDDDLVPITTKVNVINKGTSSNPKYITSVRAREDRTDYIAEKTVYGVSLQDTNGNDLSRTGSKSTPRTDKTTTDSDQNSWVNATSGLTWDNLLASLGEDKKIELLGTLLRNFRGNLPNIVSGANGVLDIKGTGTSNIAGDLVIAKSITANGGTYNANTDDTEFKFNKAVKSGKNYITFSNGLRLYISNTVPGDTDIPIGSIGIGWGMNT